MTGHCRLADWVGQLIHYHNRHFLRVAGIERGRTYKPIILAYTLYATLPPYYTSIYSICYYNLSGANVSGANVSDPDISDPDISGADTLPYTLQIYLPDCL